MGKRVLAIEFQLHHTGIKTNNIGVFAGIFVLFQLHHTGIKTVKLGSSRRSSFEFQLHHTGIKTRSLTDCPTCRS